MVFRLVINEIKDAILQANEVDDDTATSGKRHLHYANLISERLLNKPYIEEVTLSKQNPAFKCCQSLEILTNFLKGIDLSMLKIWDLQVKGLQSYQLSNIENDLTPVQLELCRLV